MLNRITNAVGPVCDELGFICVNERFIYDTRQMVYPRQYRSKAVLEELVLFCWEWNLVHKHANEVVKFKINKNHQVEVLMCGVWLKVSETVLKVLPEDSKAIYGKLQIAIVGEFLEVEKLS